jgi:hypothetical protein
VRLWRRHRRPALGADAGGGKITFRGWEGQSAQLAVIRFGRRSAARWRTPVYWHRGNSIGRDA